MRFAKVKKTKGKVPVKYVKDAKNKKKQRKKSSPLVKNIN